MLISGTATRIIIGGIILELATATADQSSPTWRFAKIPDDQVAPDVTQRDQFANDSVELFQSLVREATQNSTDSPLPESADPVRLRFAVGILAGEEAERLKKLCLPVVQNCEACGMDTSVIDDVSARVLIVEDFNTTGLVGATDKHDDGNFCGFWRRHGGSNKDASKGGSHGLGKLVFSTTSALGVVFGHTIRVDDGRSVLMGTAILNNHKIGGARYPAHGYWAPAQKTGEIQKPTEDEALISSLGSLFRFRRTTETGLSLAVPYVDEDINEDSILRAVVTNYFFPILSGTLVVEVGEIEIAQANFAEIAAGLSGLSDDQKSQLEFVQELVPLLKSQPQIVLSEHDGTKRISPEIVTEDKIEKMRTTYKSGKTIHVRVPVKVHRKKQPKVTSYVDLYLKQKPENCTPWALFARESLVLPGESRSSFGESAYGALIAADPEVCALLRDAENPAHTKWNAQEKVKKNWSYGPQTVRDIRLSLSALYRMVTAELREEYTDLLLDMLSIADPSPKKRKGPKTPKKPVIPLPPPKPKFFRESKVEGGFRISAGPGASEREYPVRMRIRVAYDVLSGNPFKSHDSYDFDLSKNGLEIAGKDIKLVDREAGTLVLECTSPEFRLKITGFDPNRDLIIDPRVAS